MSNNNTSNVFKKKEMYNSTDKKPKTIYEVLDFG